MGINNKYMNIMLFFATCIVFVVMLYITITSFNNTDYYTKTSKCSMAGDNICSSRDELGFVSSHFVLIQNNNLEIHRGYSEKSLPRDAIKVGDLFKINSGKQKDSELQIKKILINSDDLLSFIVTPNTNMTFSDVHDFSICNFCCDGGLPANVDNKKICSKCSGITGSCDMGNVEKNSNKKIIIIRHGQDKDPADSYYDHGGKKFKAYLPNNSTKEYGLQWLSDIGCEQAEAYAIALPKFIKQQKYSPVVKVFTQDPDPFGETSNPMRTIYDFIINCDIQDVEFNHPPGDNLSSYTTDDIEGSVVMCFTSQVINGNHKQHYQEKGSILYNIKKKMGITDNLKGPPGKGTSIYVISSNGKVEYFNLDTPSKTIVSGWKY